MPSGSTRIWERSHKQAIASTLGEGESLPSNYLFMDAPAAWEYPERAREPAPDWKQIREDSNVWYNLKPGSPEWRVLGQEIMDWYVEEWFDWIGAVGEVPAIIVAKNNLGNVVTPGLWPGIGVSDVLVSPGRTSSTGNRGSCKTPVAAGILEVRG